MSDLHAFAGVTLDPTTGELLVGDSVVRRLSKAECTIMTRLFRRPTRTVTHAQLLDELWGNRADGPDQGCVTVIVFRARRKLRGLPLTIKSDHGIGYRLEAA